MSTGLTISIMKSAKSLTSALHSFSVLSSLLFLTLFGSSAYFPLILPVTLHPKPHRKTNLPLPHLLLQLTSLVHIYRHFFSPIYIFSNNVLYLFHNLSSRVGPISLIERRLLIFPHTKAPLPPPLTGVWAFNIQSMPPSSEASFSTVGFDGQVPPLPLRPYRSRSMRERDAGREEGDAECTLRTAIAEQTDRWAKAFGSGEGRQWRVWYELKGLPLLGMRGTSRLSSSQWT